MTSRDRVLTALGHSEPDRVPLDLSSTHVTGIAVVAYRRLREHLGLPEREPQICDHIQQVCVPHDDVMDRFGVDTRGLFPWVSANWNFNPEDKGDAWEITDEWGLVQRMSKDEGLYYSLVRSPLDGLSVPVQQIDSYPWPRADDPARMEGLRQEAERFRSEGKVVVLKGLAAGLSEMAIRLRGMENFLVDLLSDEATACRLLDKVLELKLTFWQMALPKLGGLVDVVLEADDYGTQESQLISPDLFRRIFKPRLAELLGGIREAAPNARILFHSCGSVREIIPDLIEIGVDILNPVHITAAGMEPAALKRDFGDALSFWGGGVDTQGVLPMGTPDEVRDDVRRNVEALAPGGGYVFNTVHNIQADVPPENVVAMYDTLAEVGRY